VIGPPKRRPSNDAGFTADRSLFLSPSVAALPAELGAWRAPARAMEPLNSAPRRSRGSRGPFPEHPVLFPAHVRCLENLLGRPSQTRADACFRLLAGSGVLFRPLPGLPPMPRRMLSRVAPHWLEAASASFGRADERCRNAALWRIQRGSRSPRRCGTEPVLPVPRRAAGRAFNPAARPTSLDQLLVFHPDHHKIGCLADEPRPMSRRHREISDSQSSGFDPRGQDLPRQRPDFVKERPGR